MLKKIGLVAAALVAGAFSAGGAAAADTPAVHEHNGYHHGGFGSDSDEQFGLVNLGDTDALHSVDGTVGFCDNNVNVLGVQVPIQDTGNVGRSPRDCASDGTADGGTGMGG